MNEDDEAVAASLNRPHPVAGQDLSHPDRHPGGSLKESLLHEVSPGSTKKHLDHGAGTPAVGAVVMFVVFSFFLTYIRLITKMASGP